MSGIIIPFETTLLNGPCVRLRPVTAADRRLIEIGFGNLSERSRYLRFLRSVRKLSDHELTHLADVDGPNHKAVGALDTGKLKPTPVGIARYFRLADEPNVAEFAVTVADSYQRIGLGGLLTGALTHLAILNGITEFVAFVHIENWPMQKLFRALGAKNKHISGAEYELRLPLFDDAARYPATPAGDAMRAAYRLTKTG